MVDGVVPKKKARGASLALRDTYIVQSEVASYGHEGIKATDRVVVTSDGKRIHVIERKALQRAIKAAMKEFA